ncbi:alcohol dehydrogenase, zinc-binding [Labilithrix luteola]|uniref:Alcohol dehydrogenase, zinc-binding n=1 Tax=Labilithrix luteola TaxID=1391654 RepID=A0A0K1Q1T3_9BACT|nr:zinc-binding dehydrogenase [Labilithrix luteola]AKU99611.1 alcohol dehydrogenase, zinc-binding [Labilithrix luteola]
MRALTYDPKSPQGLRAEEVSPPEPGASQALVEVHATSLNFGEVAFMSEIRRPGEIPGWDAAGIVVRAAADGSGPKEGARVAGFAPNAAWAELRAVRTADLGVLPDAVDFESAAALPAAGVSALRAVRALGPLVGRRVLITGASGGVGRFAVQLAHRAGAHVIAAVGNAARGEGLRELGADEVVTRLDQVTSPVFGVLDNVGGAMLAEALALVERGGSLQSIGQASREPSTVDFERERRRASGRRIDIFVVGSDFGSDIEYLASLVARRELDPQIGWRGDWERAGEAAAALLGRRVSGKAVLTLRKQPR